jgi:hypothetical protein
MKDGFKRLIKGPYWDSAVAEESEPEPMSRAELRRWALGLVALLPVVLAIAGYWWIGTHHHGHSGVAAGDAFAFWVALAVRLGWQWRGLHRRG